MSILIEPRLSAVIDGFNQKAPEPVKMTVNQARAGIVAGFDRSKAPQVGDTLPPFSLPNATGEKVTLQDLLAKSQTKGVLMTFYRGGWCPFCSIALHGLQEHLKEFDAAGITLVAISPELPDRTLSTKEKNELEFEVLSDKGTEYAKKLGILWKIPDELKPILTQFGNDLDVVNGNNNWTAPLPTNILVDKQGKVRNVFIEADWTKRLEPSTAVGWAQAL